MSAPTTMRALAISDVTPANKAQLSEVPVPKVTPGRLLIRVRGFGLNHSEQALRQGEVLEPYIKKPCVPGIECVGEVADPGDTEFEVGQKVCALMGGMGRSFWGGYAEYALVPAHHCFVLPEVLTSRYSWAELAAIPETYFTAWGSLFEAMNLEPSDTLLVRGATSALGYAAIQLARAAGARVIATTHRESRLPEVEALLGEGDQAVLDTGELMGKLDDEHITRALEIVGPATLEDTLRCMQRHGIVCNMGVLGGVETLREWDPIKGIPDQVFLTSFYSNRPTTCVMEALFTFIAAHELRSAIGAQFSFDELPAALAAQDAGGTRGKIVVTM